MFYTLKKLLVLTTILALLFATGAKPRTPGNGTTDNTGNTITDNTNTTNTNTNTTTDNTDTTTSKITMTGTISVSPNQARGRDSVTVSYTKSKYYGYIRVFSVDQNTLLTMPGDHILISYTSFSNSFIAPSDLGRYTYRLFDPDTGEFVAESNVLEVIEYTPSLTVDKPTYATGEQIIISLNNGSVIEGSNLYMINSDTGIEVPGTRQEHISGVGNSGAQAPSPGKYQMIHTRDATGKIIARSSIFTVVPPTPRKTVIDYINSINDNPTNTTAPMSGNPVINPPGTGRQNTIILRIGSPYMTVNGASAQVDSASTKTTPVIVNGRTLLPIRSIIETLGGAVSWDGKEQKVTVTLGEKTIELWINKKTVNVNGTTKTIDVPPQTINGRTMLPIRFITENLGHSVAWDEKTQQVTLTTN